MPNPEVVINEGIVKQVAALSATGATVAQIATQLTISKYHAKRILATSECKAAVKDIGDAAITGAKQIIRSQTSDMASEVVRVIKERLEDNDLEAVKVALKVIGFDQDNKDDRGDTNIVVQLPGSAQKHVTSEFEVIGEIEDEQPN